MEPFVAPWFFFFLSSVRQFRPNISRFNLSEQSMAKVSWKPPLTSCDHEVKRSGHVTSLSSLTERVFIKLISADQYSPQPFGTPPTRLLRPVWLSVQIQWGEIPWLWAVNARGVWRTGQEEGRGRGRRAEGDIQGDSCRYTHTHTFSLTYTFAHVHTHTSLCSLDTSQITRGNAGCLITCALSQKQGLFL